MRVLCIQHVPFEQPGAIGDWIARRGHTLEIVEIWKGGDLPAVASFDLLLVLGGPMGVYEQDRYPWIAAELELIQEAVAAERYVLGICLGAQLLAAALGGRVYSGERKEIGWFPIRLTSEGRCSDLFGALDPEFTPFHWHGDTFDLPEGSVLLATSALYPNQAFMYGDRVIGLQFHLEVRPQDARAMIEHCGRELLADTYVQSAEQLMESPGRFAKSHTVLFTFLDRWLPERSSA